MRAGAGSPAGILDRWTRKARRALGAAADLAERSRGEAVRPEHVLLGVLKVRRSAGAHVLRALGVDAVGLEREAHERLAVAPGGVHGAREEASPDTRRVLLRAAAEACREGRAEVGTGHLLLGLTAQPGPTNEVLADPDLDRLLCGWPDGVVTLWDTTRAVTRRRFDAHRSAVACLAANPAWTRALAGAEDGSLQVLDLVYGGCPFALEGHEGAVRVAAWSPTQAVGVTGSEEGTVGIWNLQSGRLIRVVPAHQGPVGAVAFTPDGETALSGGADRLVHLWSIALGQEVARLDGHTGPVVRIESVHGQPQVTSYSDAGESIRWDLHAERAVETLPPEPPADAEGVAELLRRHGITVDKLRAAAADS
ncbi:MAG: Clp protease N-terminal domain-containing protein [Planctomycetota bacterium]